MKCRNEKAIIAKTLVCMCLIGGMVLAAGCDNDSASRVINVDNTNCTEGETRCSEDLSSTLTCNDKGEWDNLTRCPADKPICNADTGLCESAGDGCDPGQSKCDDASHQAICGDDHNWKVEACPTDKPNCNSDLGRCVPAGYECDPGNKECADEANLKTCGDDHKWHTEPCPNDKPKCYGGVSQCVEDAFECDTGESTCSDDSKGIKTCGENNKWAAPVPCPDDKPVCDGWAVECVESATECIPDAFECTDSDKYRSCDPYGMWQNGNCPEDKPVCSDREKQCIPEICIVGDFKCTDYNHFKTCLDNESWSEPEQCPSDKPICDELSKECLLPVPTNCTPDTDFCFGGNSESAAMYHCTAEGTRPEEPLYFCPDGCNDEGTACKQTKCTPKDVECTPDKSGVMTCKEDGTWDLDNIQKCQLGLSCNSDTKECECTPGEPVCTYIGSKSEGLYHCTAKGEVGERIEWCKCTSDYKACSCENDGVNELGGERRKCRGNDSMVCEGGAWKVAKNCSRSEVCNDKVGGICIPNATAGGVCNGSALVCDLNTILSCEQGLYTNADLGCEPNEYCHMGMTDTGVSAKCSSTCKNTSFCSLEGIVSCDEAGKITVRPCAKSQKCVMVPESSPIPEQVTYKATCEFDVCQEGALLCADNSILQVCKNNKWVKLVDCMTDYHLPCIEYNGEDGDIVGCYDSVLSAPLP